jgi:arsenate reductase (thioredoxin)
MKILFVCKSNIGRSQIAEAFFNQFSRYHKAISAGIDTEEYSGKRIGELSEKVCRCMLENGIDISDKLSKPLTEKLANQSDLVVWIAPEEKIPRYLNKNKLILWNIEDAGGKSYEDWCNARDKIKRLVADLVKDIKNS